MNTREDNRIIRDILLIASCRVTLKEIESWSPERKEKIVKWAAACHLRASDNNVRVPKRPRFKWKSLSLKGFHKQIRML